MEFNLYNLQSMLQNYLHEKDLQYTYKNISFCGRGLIPLHGEESAVFLCATEDSTDATFFGHQTCKNSWACPICSVKNMHRHAKRIGIAIDALKAQNQSAIMLTFTVMHHRFMSCREVVEILYTAWKQFIHKGNKKTGRHNDVYVQFRQDCNSIHHVRVAEVTFGDCGWHPHFHCLFWVDNDKLSVASRYEKALRARWEDCVEQATIKVWKKLRPEYTAKGALMKYRKLKRHSNSESQGLFMSRDKDGHLIVQESGNYITGWSAEKELTGSGFKTAKSGHFTTHQILMKAYECFGAEREYWLNLYLEFIQAIMGKNFHVRINYSSHSGLNKIIDEWATRFADQYCAKNKKIWYVVCSIPNDIWKEICYWNVITPIKQHLLELSLLPNAKILISFYLSLYDIHLNVKCHKLDEVVEDLFNAA